MASSGTVADLLEVPPGFETAVEAVLGDRLQWVVVERFEHARAALAYLGREGAGAATLLPLETLPPAPLVPADSADVSWALRMIGGARPELIGYLLGRVGVVPHLDHAEMLWRRNGIVATYVTPSGEVLTPTGRLSGGRRDSERQGNDHSILGRKRAIRQLDEELGAIRGDLETAAGALAELDAAIARLSVRRDGLMSSFKAKETARLTSQKDAESASRQEERVRRHLETVAAEAEALEAERVETRERLDELEGALGGARDTEAELDRRMRELGTELDGSREAEATLAAEETACRVDFAAASERVDALGRDIARLAELGRDFGLQMEQAGLRRSQVAERRTELRQERERTDVLAREAGAERDRREAELAVVAEEHRDGVSRREAAATESHRAQEELTAVVRRLHEIEIRATEGRVRGEELLEEARRRHGVESAEALSAAHDPAGDLDAARARHAELLEKIEGMGAVNLVADEEYRELEERLDFLRTQHEDIVGVDEGPGERAARHDPDGAGPLPGSLR